MISAISDIGKGQTWSEQSAIELNNVFRIVRKIDNIQVGEGLLLTNTPSAMRIDVARGNEQPQIPPTTHKYVAVIEIISGGDALRCVTRNEYAAAKLLVGPGQPPDLTGIETFIVAKPTGLRLSTTHRVTRAGIAYLFLGASGDTRTAEELDDNGESFDPVKIQTEIIVPSYEIGDVIVMRRESDTGVTVTDQGPIPGGEAVWTDANEDARKWAVER